MISCELLQVNRCMAYDIYDLLEYTFDSMIFHIFSWRTFQWQKLGVSKNRGIPKWMVYNGKPYFLTDDLGVPPFKETPSFSVPMQRVVGGDPPHLPRRRHAAPQRKCCDAPGSDAVVVFGGNAK